MRITAKQIAQELGISTATVSMVLNNKPGISEKTKTLVLDKAQELGYYQTLQHSHDKNRFIHFVMFNKNNMSFINSPFFQKILEAVEACAHSHDYKLIMSHFYANQNFEDQLHTLMPSHCDGFVILATNMEKEHFSFFEKLPAPTVFLDNFFPSKICDMIGIDNRQAITDAFQYLVSQGHTQIGYLASSIDIFNYRQRKEVYLQLMRSTPGISDSQKLILKIPHPVNHKLPQLEQYLSKHPKLPTAFLADTDVIAGPCMAAFQKCGYRVPEDISIIGFDNTPDFHLASPALTTLHVDAYALGRLATERLIAKLSNPSCSDIIHMSLQAPLVIRQSVSRKYR